jgi:hypothetical protein
MDIAVPDTPKLPFERFWRWLKDHAGCIIRAGSLDAVLFDLPELHWVLFDDEEGRGVVQLLRGKSLVGELVVERGDVSQVQPLPDPDDEQKGYWLFEVIGKEEADGEPLYHFVLEHAFDAAPTHQQLKH